MQIASIEQVIDKLLIFMFILINVCLVVDVNGNVQILTQIKFERPEENKAVKVLFSWNLILHTDGSIATQKLETSPIKYWIILQQLTTI